MGLPYLWSTECRGFPPKTNAGQSVTVNTKPYVPYNASNSPIAKNSTSESESNLEQLVNNEQYYPEPRDQISLSFVFKIYIYT